MNLKSCDRSLNRKFPIRFGLIVLLLSISLAYAPAAQGEEPFFSIALSRFSKKQDAAKEEARLVNSGHNAFFREEIDPGTKSAYYQVYIEKYLSRDEAEKEARVLKDLELISDYTVTEVKETPQTEPESKIPDEEKAKEELSLTQKPEGKQQAPVTAPVTEEQKTAPVPDPGTGEQIAKPELVPGDEGQTGTPETADVKTEEKAEKPGPGTPGPEEQTAAPEPPPVISKPADEPPPLEKIEEQAPEKKGYPEKGKNENDSAGNHEDSHLTGASLQVGAFTDESNAAALKIKLKNLGKNAFYRLEAADNKGDFYRLYITGYSSLREAIRDARELKKSGVISGYSRVHSGEPVSDAPPDEKAENEKEEKIYIIHISSYKNEANAAKNVAGLREYGYEAFYKFEKDLSVSWYRVYIGEFGDEAEARKKGMELLDREIISYFKPVAIDRKKLSN